MFKFLTDRFGDSSSMRLVFVGVVFAIVACVLGVFTYVGLKTATVPDIPAGVGAFAIGVIATLAGAKVYQRKVEGDSVIAEAEVEVAATVADTAAVVAEKECD